VLQLADDVRRAEFTYRYAPLDDGAPALVVIAPHSQWCRDDRTLPYPCPSHGDWEVFRLAQGATIVHLPVCQFGGMEGRIAKYVPFIERVIGRRLITRQEAFELFWMRRKGAWPSLYGTRVAPWDDEALTVFRDRLLETAAYHSSYTAYFVKRDVVSLIRRIGVPRISPPRCQACNRRWRPRDAAGDHAVAQLGYRVRDAERSWEKARRDPRFGDVAQHKAHYDTLRAQLAAAESLQWCSSYPGAGTGWCNAACRRRWDARNSRWNRRQQKEAQWLREGKQTLTSVRRWLRDPATRSRAVSTSPSAGSKPAPTSPD